MSDSLVFVKIGNDVMGKNREPKSPIHNKHQIKV